MGFGGLKAAASAASAAAAAAAAAAADFHPHAAAPTKTVAETLEISTSAKIMLKVARSTPLQPQQLYFFEKHVKINEILMLFWSKSRLPYKKR